MDLTSCDEDGTPWDFDCPRKQQKVRSDIHSRGIRIYSMRRRHATATLNIVRVRVRLAEQLYSKNAALNDVHGSIQDLVAFAKAIGVPDARRRDETLLSLTRLTAADNDCEYCDLWGCKARRTLKNCPCMNTAIAKFNLKI